MKLLEWVLDFYVHEMVNIGEMKFGFVPGRGTTDALYMVRQLQEKYIAANKLFYFAFVDFEKAFDRVPKKDLWWALRSLVVGMGCDCHPGHVLKCPDSCAGQ